MTKKKIARSEKLSTKHERSTGRSIARRTLPRMARARKPEKAADGLLYLKDAMKLEEAKALVAALQQQHDAANPKAEEGYLFANDGEVSPTAPLAKLIAAMFQATNAPEFHDPAKDLMASVLCSIADDCDLINGLNNGMDNCFLVERATFRLNYRALMAVEIARRIDKGEVTP